MFFKEKENKNYTIKQPNIKNNESKVKNLSNYMSSES